METALTTHSVNDIARMSDIIVKSGLFGMKTPQQIGALMLVAQAEGLHPATAARDYHIIQGRPALKSDAMLARFQESGGIVEWHKMEDDEVVGYFIHKKSPKPVKISWTMERAKNAGLGAKDNWKKYPRQMLRARVVSEGVRTCYPAACNGVYTPEEVQDFEPVKPVETKAEVIDNVCPECQAPWDNEHNRCSANCQVS